MERTAISKLSSRVISLDAYADIKQMMQLIERNEMPEINLDEILIKLSYRKVCERVCRVSTPISRSYTETVPSPKHKAYKTSLVQEKKPVKIKENAAKAESSKNN